MYESMDIDSSSESEEENIDSFDDAIALTINGRSNSLMNALNVRGASAREEDLAALEKRYEAVYDRYLAQFTAMETMMESMNGTKDYLEGQLESLSKAYDND